MIFPKQMRVPQRVGSLKIQTISWADFKAQPPQDSPFLAHIYWTINYEYPPLIDGKKQTVTIDVRVQPKSWVLESAKSNLNLLKHQYGHYLIGCLCALQFQKRINYINIRNSSINFSSFCKTVLHETLKEFCALEKRYDQQTNHNINKQKQSEWEQWIGQEFISYKKFFDERRQKAKFFKMSKKKKQGKQNRIGTSVKNISSKVQTRGLSVQLSKGSSRLPRMAKKRQLPIIKSKQSI